MVIVIKVVLSALWHLQHFLLQCPSHFDPAVVKLIAYLSGCLVPSVGAVQFKTKAVPLSTIDKLVGAPTDKTSGGAGGVDENAEAGIISICPD
jgi:hypothetical protein